MRNSEAMSLDAARVADHAQARGHKPSSSPPRVPATSRGSARSAVALVALLAWVAHPVAAVAQTACASPKDDLFANPFTYKSAHHRPIGTGAIYASDTANATKDWLKADLFNINNGLPAGTGVYEVDNGDPLLQVNGFAKCGKVVGMPINLRIPVGGFPPALNPTTVSCPDNAIVVFDRGNRADPNDDKVYQLRQYYWNGGSPTAERNKFLDVRGLGHGLYYGDMLGGPAAGVSTLFGVLRGAEIGTPGLPIEHALAMGLPYKPGCTSMLGRDVRLPATNRDSTATKTRLQHRPYSLWCPARDPENRQHPQPWA